MEPAMPTILGTAADETLAGGDSRDALYGFDGNDSLDGGFGIDTLVGGNGDDTLAATGGGDALTGGAGADTFRILALNGVTITDFTAADRIDLAAFGIWRFLGAEAFTGRGGELRFEATASLTLLQYDADGDGAADATATIAGGGFQLEENAQWTGVLILAADLFVAGTDAADALFGGAGRDTLTGGRGQDTLQGGDGGDRLLGGAGRDVLVLGADDTLIGGGGADFFQVVDRLPEFRATIGDFGVDDVIDLTGLVWTLIGEAAFSGAPGEVRVVTTALGLAVEIDAGGDGVADGTITIDAPADVFGLERSRDARLVAAPNRLIEGGPTGDLLRGGAGRDSVYGLDGADTLNGSGQDDLLAGAGGRDLLLGGDGDDRLIGGTDDDVLRGGAGADQLRGEDGNDTLIGGAGADFFDGGAGADLFVLGGIDALRGDTISGLTGGGVIDLSALPALLNVGGLALPGGGVAALTFVVSANTQTILIDRDGDGTADAAFSITTGLPPQGLVEIENRPGFYRAAISLNRTGTEFADTLSGGPARDTLRGAAGDDSIAGGFGADLLYGDDGNDTIDGGFGGRSVGSTAPFADDTLFGGNGDDRLITGTSRSGELTGGDGADVFVFVRDDPGFSTRAGPGVRITDFAEQDRIDLSALGPLHLLAPGERFTLRPGEITQSPGGLQIDFDGDGVGDFSISASANAFAETAPGSGVLQGAGLVLQGSGSADTLVGSAADDRIQGFGGDDTLFGNDGNDLLDGGVERDRLDGGAGRDTLIGGPGADTLTGGAGDDIFVFNRDDLNDRIIDTIADFTVGSDRIDLSSIDANRTVPGDQAFTFIGENAFTGAGQARFSGGELQLNVDSGLAADFTARLVGVTSLTASDLIVA